MSSINGSRSETREPTRRAREFSSSADALIRISLPPGTPREAEVAIARLIELTGMLARRASQLQEALDSRIVIEQAKGVLAERFALTVDEAFRYLRQGARSNRMPLRELATRVIASPMTPPEIRLPSELRLPAMDGRH